jgi:hypothetical protein
VESLRDTASDADLVPSHHAAERTSGGPPSLRASNQDRDGVVTRLQEAFAEGRLDDAEFDERMRAALTAKTHADLDILLADLPGRAAHPAGPIQAGTNQAGTNQAGTVQAARPVAGRPGRFAIAWKGSVRRAGRWRVPERYTTVVYKGGGELDLRAAELLSPATTIVAVAYKSQITLLVPPGVRVEMTGFGITQGPSDPADEALLAPDAPVLNIRGVAYKGTIMTSTRPAGRPQLP